MSSFQNSVSGVRSDIEDNILFYIVASASFVEITSDLYTRNLIDYFDDDVELASWLRDTWERQELGHGAQLKNYVEARWPGFDWVASYEKFYEEFRAYCTPSAMPASRAEELAALCVIETGTASLYRMLADASAEPELRLVARRIGAEEIGHYKQFLRYFFRYRAREEMTTLATLRACWAEVMAIDGVDAFYAFKHVYMSRNPGAVFDSTVYRQFRKTSRRLAWHYFPRQLAVRMLLKLLPVPLVLQRIVRDPLISMSRLLLLF